MRLFYAWRCCNAPNELLISPRLCIMQLAGNADCGSSSESSVRVHNRFWVWAWVRLSEPAGSLRECICFNGIQGKRCLCTNSRRSDRVQMPAALYTMKLISFCINVCRHSIWRSILSCAREWVLILETDLVWKAMFVRSGSDLNHIMWLATALHTVNASSTTRPPPYPNNRSPFYGPVAHLKLFEIFFCGHRKGLLIRNIVIENYFRQIK